MRSDAIPPERRGRPSSVRTAATLAILPAMLLLGACEVEESPGEETYGEEEAGISQRESVSGSADQESGTAQRTARRTAGAAEEEAGDIDAAVVPTGTVMTVRLDETVSTESHEAGSEFRARVTQDVHGPDRAVLISEGATVTGVVEESKRSGGPEDPAILALRLESVEVDGHAYPLNATVQNADPERTEGDSGAETAAKIAIGTAAGALIGQVLGSDTESTLGGAAAGAAAGTIVALTSRGGDATLSEGSTLRVQLNDPIRLERSSASD